MPKKAHKIVEFTNHSTGEDLCIDHKGNICEVEYDENKKPTGGCVYVSAKELEQIAAYSDAAVAVKLPKLPNQTTGGYEVQVDPATVSDNGGSPGDVMLGCQVITRNVILAALKVSRKVRGRK